MLRRLRRSKVAKLITLGILIHALVLKAAFDIYFSSPIDHGMTPVRTTDEPPAKRLVLIVADGLRAQAIYGPSRISRVPNLTKIRYTRGSWGISHTRVPTESRPGHVALLGGIFEDPSAILSGWKKNPVEFDSVINQSTNAWCWGSPDIVNMFNKDNLSHIHVYTYDASIEDFGKKNTGDLDIWVFNKVERFIKEQMACGSCKDFRQTGNLFFLHLLGIDTAGHGFKPESMEYMANIKLVDDNIPKIEQLFEQAFPDNGTAYIVTADHGMTNWGSHGAGSAHETQTPFIAWGAGIRNDSSPQDLFQVDTAPLISSLIGINIPINSVGQIPYPYIEASIENLSQMLISNVKQLYEIFNVKRNRRLLNAIKFVPYPRVPNEEIEQRVKNLDTFLASGRYSFLKDECLELMDILISASSYYHNYYQLPILIAVAIGLLGFIIYLATCNIHIARYRCNYKILVGVQMFGFLPAYFIMHCILFVQHVPLMYYVYFNFPIFMTQVLFRRYVYILEGLKTIKNFGFRYAILYMVLYIFGIRLLVAGFHKREAYAFAMHFLAFFVFVFKHLRESTNYGQKSAWIVNSVLMGIFPFLPVMKTKFTPGTYLVGYLFWWASVDKALNKILDHPQHVCNRILIIRLQLEFIKYTPLFVFFVEYGLIASDSPIKYLVWIWAIYPVLCIPNSCDYILPRLTSVFAGFVPFYLLVSANYEALFLVLYTLQLYLWAMMETRWSYRTIFKSRFTDSFPMNKNQTIDDFRRAFSFIVMIFIGFFGTGNIASLNSFDPMWVRCFLTVFSPFKMAALILSKIMVPFIFVTCTFQAINIVRRGDTHKMFCLVLMMSDIMVLELLFCITNVGSWLQIGMSLSHFIIMESFVLIILVLYGIGYYLTTINYAIRINNYLTFLMAPDNIEWLFHDRQ